MQYSFLTTENCEKKLNVKLSIRKQSELFEHEKELLKNANLHGIADVEAWTAEGTNKEMAYSTHGAFRFFGKFPPPIATHMINSYTTEHDLVWDPMCGSGTTGVECLLTGRRCMLNDVNPLSRLLARVKTRYIPHEKLLGAVERVKKVYRPVGFDEVNFQLKGLRNPDHWFLPETSRSLLGLRQAIEKETDPYLRDFLWLVFASIIRRVSRATTEQGRLFLDEKTALEDALPTFLKRAEIAIKGISTLPPNGESIINITEFNLIETVPDEFQHTAKLAIVHPPYFNSYKYSSINSLELAWLGYNISEIRRSEVREFFKVGKPENVHRYVEDMVKVIRNAKKLIVPNGVMGLMIGDTIMKKTHIPVTRMILDHLVDEDLTVETIALRVPKYTEATWVASQRRKGNNVGVSLYDYIIILRRRQKS